MNTHKTLHWIGKCTILVFILSLSLSLYAKQMNLNGYKSIAKNSKIELLYNAKDNNLAIKDLKNGYVWKSIVDESFYDLENLNKQWKDYLQSPIVINYINLDKRDTPPSKAYSNVDAQIVESSFIKDGIALTYQFTDIGITLEVQYSIKDNQFVVSILADKIKEEMVLKEPTTGSTTKKDQLVETYYGIVSVEVLPFLGASGNEVDGYLLYPDGCGGLTYYSEVENRPTNVKMGKWYTYANMKANIDELKDSVIADRYTATLPILGIKNNQNAMIGAVTKGEEQFGITVYPSGYVIDLNHSNFEVFMRQQYDINTSNVSIDGSNVGKVATRVEEKISATDVEIRYFMLNGEEANYSGMAKVYREYLMKQGLLVDRINENDKIPLSISLFMGITKEMMLFDKYIATTTFADTIKMSTELNDAGIKDVKFILRGWQEGGYGEYPVSWPPERNIGGKKGLSELDKYLNTVNHQVYLENNFLLGRKNSGGFSARNDVVMSASNIPVMSQDGELFLLNPTSSINNNGEFLDKLTQYNHVNIAYEDLGEVIYQDYHKTYPSTRNQTVFAWRRLLEEGRNKNKKIAVEGGNQYSYSFADYLYNVPADTFGYFITDEEIPFLQMILSGLIPYSSLPGNLAYDLDLQKLKWIEYGCIPHFELTKQPSIKLRDTEYNHLFTSQYEHWKDSIIELYKEYDKNLDCVYGEQMVSHTRIQKDVVKIIYSNDIEIIINYGDKKYSYKGNSVPAKDYRVIQ